MPLLKHFTQLLEKYFQTQRERRIWERYFSGEDIV